MEPRYQEELVGRIILILIAYKFELQKTESNAREFSNELYNHDFPNWEIFHKNLLKGKVAYRILMQLTINLQRKT